jgi:hypothetical protein
MGCTSGNFSSPLPNGQAENEYDNYHDVQLLQGRSFPIRRRAKSWKAIKQTNVVVQKYDYSCGAAALATMFRYYFQDDVTEDDVLKETLKTLTPEEIKDRQENGLSMNDLFKTAAKMGYLATVYRLPVEKIRELPAPMIVRIEKHGYKHFVVLRGAIEDRVFLADPTRGNIRLSIHEFLEQWSGEVLILGKKGFGLPKDHPLALKHPSPVQNEYEPARRWLYRVVRGPPAF